MCWSHCNLFVNVRPKYLADVTGSSVCPWSWYLASIIFFLLVTLSTAVLGPGLFLYYINDLQPRLTSTVRLFADDTIAYLTISRISVCWPSCKFLEMSSTNSMSGVSQEWPFRNPCCSGYRILFSSPCFMILLANICSIVLIGLC
jgi:hypothetical protein